MGKVRVFWQALFSYTFTGQKTRSSKCQSWDGDVKKNHLCPGYVATVFFLFFELEKKAYYHRKNRTQNSWIPCEFPPSLSPTPKRGGGELNVGLTRLPPYPPAFLYSPLPGGACVFLPRWQWVSLRRGIPLKKMVWNLFKRWRWDRRFGLRIKFKHRSFRSEPHRFFSVGGASYLLAKAWVTGKNQ